ncbi:MAG TPA: arsenosugar biosynthesis radical SAM protein ArsS [Gammaproteobacteria bacterium]|nr:arsenosugar biosynthesis radical SAM protein ArsS [Gammaproteobacteria bacterium]
MLNTLEKLTPSTFPQIHRGQLQTLQVNLGYRCNQQCLHCHVAAGPNRPETLSAGIADLVIETLHTRRFPTLDLTGGAPELNAQFRRLVTAARALGVKVIDRCNLTVLQEPGQEDLGEFLAANTVEIVASLPCYLEDNVNRQRGKGVFDRSIAALRSLNALGYGDPAGELPLNLVYNPQGPALPPPQSSLESDYRRVLWEDHGVHFNQLLALANLPIQRFGSTLLSHGQFDDYVSLLKQAHCHENLDQVMCRSLLSVDWQGYLYDCDFNQMLGLGLRLAGATRPHLRDLPRLTLAGNPIAVADHCYGCTAGQGSSCGGALQNAG